MKNIMVQSAGFVIIDFRMHEPKVLCLRNEWGSWDFPKGRLEEGETIFDAAIRETREECDLDMLAGDFIPIEQKPFSVAYMSGRSPKTTTYFFAERLSSTTPNLPINPELGKPEHVRWEWMGVDALYKKMPRRLQGLVSTIENITDVKR